MSGHNKWGQIKHQKGVTDQKRGALFSKLLSAISVAARGEPNPDFNSRLRSAILKAKTSNVPQENIERAIRRAADKNETLVEMTMEAYGPGGAAILIDSITDSKNRTVAEIKKILSEGGGKWAEPGSVRFAFEEKPGDEERWVAKFTQPLSPEDKKTLDSLTSALLNHADTQKVSTNAA